jgi:hypothetical protein
MTSNAKRTRWERVGGSWGGRIADTQLTVATESGAVHTAVA